MKKLLKGRIYLSFILSKCSGGNEAWFCREMWSECQQNYLSRRGRCGGHPLASGVCVMKLASGSVLKSDQLESCSSIDPVFEKAAPTRPWKRIEAKAKPAARVDSFWCWMLSWWGYAFLRWTGSAVPKTAFCRDWNEWFPRFQSSLLWRHRGAFDSAMGTAIQICRSAK